jgi:hypothetical protein
MKLHEKLRTGSYEVTGAGETAGSAVVRRLAGIQIFGYPRE